MPLCARNTACTRRSCLNSFPLACKIPQGGQDHISQHLGVADTGDVLCPGLSPLPHISTSFDYKEVPGSIPSRTSVTIRKVVRYPEFMSFLSLFLRFLTM